MVFLVDFHAEVIKNIPEITPTQIEIIAMEYVTQIGGLMSEKDYPYCVGTGDCWPCSPPHYNSSFCTNYTFN